MPNARPRPRRGFSLVEVVVAVTLLAGGLLAAALCLERASRAARGATARAAIIAVARDRTELARADVCASAASAGAADSADLHVDWSVRRATPVAYVRAHAQRAPVAGPADSASAYATVWCGA